MGEVTPEMVETYRRMVGQSKCGSGCRFEAPGYLGRLAQIKVMEALLSEWEELSSPVLAKYQPCGCVTCHCEGQEQCLGCGAKSCGTHPLGQIPNPVYEDGPVRKLQLRAEEAERSLAEARAEAKDYEDVIVRGQKALGDAGVTPGANGDLHPGIAELADQLAEARETIAHLNDCLVVSYDTARQRTEHLRTAEGERDSAREKLAKVVRLVDVIRRANEPCDAEYGYCVHCACVEALAAAKGGE